MTSTKTKSTTSTNKGTTVARKVKGPVVPTSTVEALKTIEGGEAAASVLANLVSGEGWDVTANRESVALVFRSAYQAGDETSNRIGHLDDERKALVAKADALTALQVRIVGVLAFREGYSITKVVEYLGADASQRSRIGQYRQAAQAVVGIESKASKALDPADVVAVERGLRIADKGTRQAALAAATEGKSAKSVLASLAGKARESQRKGTDGTGRKVSAKVALDALSAALDKVASRTGEGGGMSPDEMTRLTDQHNRLGNLLKNMPTVVDAPA